MKGSAGDHSSNKSFLLQSLNTRLGNFTIYNTCYHEIEIAAGRPKQQKNNDSKIDNHKQNLTRKQHTYKTSEVLCFSRVVRTSQKVTHHKTSFSTSHLVLFVYLSSIWGIFIHESLGLNSFSLRSLVSCCAIHSFFMAVWCISSAFDIFCFTLRFMSYNLVGSLFINCNEKCETWR